MRSVTVLASVLRVGPGPQAGASTDDTGSPEFHWIRDSEQASSEEVVLLVEIPARIRKRSPHKTQAASKMSRTSSSESRAACLQIRQLCASESTCVVFGTAMKKYTSFNTHHMTQNKHFEMHFRGPHITCLRNRRPYFAILSQHYIVT